MDIRQRKSPPKRQLNKTMSNPNLTLKRNKSKDTLHKTKDTLKNKDAFDQTRLKKRIQMMQAPQLLLKIHYKGKKLSVPITSVADASLKALVEPNIYRFEKEILKNPSFDIREVENWKTVGKVDYLKDYYFQTDKPMGVFRGEILQIQPIWHCRTPKLVQIRDFQIIKCIGTGGFSKVFLVRKRGNGKFYALKLMEKEGLLESGKQCVVTNQRDIMVDLDNPYVLRMDYAFQTCNFVAFALEYCPGGELFYYLRKVKRMTEDEARYCFIEILTGFKYLHSKKIIYRDIKPQNIIIDHDGHLKIADFGLSKGHVQKDESTYTYCGSPQYMAPQMLNKSGHTFAVDYYCLGALLYELVTGNPPFYSRDVQKIYYSIQHEQVDFPSYIDLSPQIKMLLSGLLVKDPHRRLGSLGGIRQILAHPWVRKLKVADVVQRKIPTPIRVDLLIYNINQQQIGQTEQQFQRKLRQQQSDTRPFQPMFLDFYFARQTSSPPTQIIPDDLKIPISKQSKQSTLNNKQNVGSNKDATVISMKMAGKGQESTLNPQKRKQLKKTKSKNKLNNDLLVERAKRRPDKSVKKEPKKQRVMSPNPRLQSKGLKRIKSSGALRDIFK